MDGDLVSITAQKIDTRNEESVLDGSRTNGLGRLAFRHPDETFALTPASMVLLKAIADNKGLLHGIGLDCGSGVGCQAILAAKIDTVDIVYGLEISKDNVNATVQNTNKNKVDLVGKMNDRMIYVQATAELINRDVVRKEFGNLNGIDDNYLNT